MASRNLTLLTLGRTAWTEFDRAVQHEWWIGNGAGGWASGTVSGACGRYYHGLLAAALHPPVERTMLLVKLDATLEAGGGTHRLSCNRWASGAVEDEGLRYLRAFCLAPYPAFHYTAGGWVIEQRIFPVHGHNATVIRYRLAPGPGAPPEAVLRLRPLVTCRTTHGVLRATGWPFHQQAAGPAVAITAHAEAAVLHLRADGGTYTPGGVWYEGFYYPYEENRGEPAVEDLYNPGEFSLPASGPAEFTLLAFAGPTRPPGIDEAVGALPQGWGAGAERRERERVRALLRPFTDPVARVLAYAGDQFVCHRASTGSRTLLAGFPWFTDWGRDAMIALPGLTLTTGRHDLARELLGTFAWHARDGLIPNCFPDQGTEPLYNTADATLWYIAAAWRYLQATGDRGFVLEDLYPFLKEVIHQHLKGTRFGIGVTREWLLRCGSPTVQVTWMDARVGDWVVTPRDGLPVEIQALWHNALQIMARLAEAAGDRPDPYAGIADQVRAAFIRRFWHREGGYLYDRIADDGSPDAAIRPNQLFAVSLDFPLVGAEIGRQVVGTVWRELWTPFGLRSLAPGDPGYAGRYLGTRLERDAAYHQGTAWAWLVGPFVSAYLKAYGRTTATLTFAAEILRPFRDHLYEFGIGSIAEIFDGDPPHLPRGCPAQAWSVAELLRIWVDELGHR